MMSIKLEHCDSPYDMIVKASLDSQVLQRLQGMGARKVNRNASDEEGRTTSSFKDIGELSLDDVMNASQPDLLGASTSDMSASATSASCASMSDCSRQTRTSISSSKKSSKRMAKRKSKYRQLLSTTSAPGPTSKRSSLLPKDSDHDDETAAKVEPSHDGSFNTNQTIDIITFSGPGLLDIIECSKAASDTRPSAKHDEPKQESVSAMDHLTERSSIKPKAASAGVNAMPAKSTKSDDNRQLKNQSGSSKEQKKADDANPMKQAACDHMETQEEVIPSRTVSTSKDVEGSKSKLLLDILVAMGHDSHHDGKTQPKDCGRRANLRRAVSDLGHKLGGDALGSSAHGVQSLPASKSCSSSPFMSERRQMIRKTFASLGGSSLRLGEDRTGTSMSQSPGPLRVPRRITGKMQLPNTEVAARLAGTKLAHVAAAAGIKHPQKVPTAEDEPTTRSSVRKQYGQILRRTKSHNSASAKEMACRATELSRPPHGNAGSVAQKSMPLRTTSLSSRAVQAGPGKVSHAHRRPRAPPRNSLPPQQPNSCTKADDDKNVCQIRRHRTPPPQNTLLPLSQSDHQQSSFADVHGDGAPSHHVKRGSLTSIPPRSKSAGSTSSSVKRKELRPFFDWEAYAAGSCGCGKGGSGKHTHQNRSDDAYH